MKQFSKDRSTGNNHKYRNQNVKGYGNSLRNGIRHFDLQLFDAAKLLEQVGNQYGRQHADKKPLCSQHTAAQA